MKSVQILPLDFSDLQHGLEVICTSEGEARQGAVEVMLRDVATLPPCSAREAFLLALSLVSAGGSVVNLPMLFADLAVAFSGASAAAYIDKKRHERNVATGKKGGRAADTELHERRAAAVARLMQKNKRLSKEAACAAVASSEGVSLEAVKKSLRKVEK